MVKAARFRRRAAAGPGCVDSASGGNGPHASLDRFCLNGSKLRLILPSSINDPSGYNAQFVYAPGRSRLKQISTYAGHTETTICVVGLFEKLKCHPVVLVLPGWEVARESAA